MSMLFGCLWVLASAAVALLPMRHQYVPGVALLIAAPVLIGLIGYEHGWFALAIALFAFVSMFRNPLIYLWKRARGERPRIPQ
ncbi:MAG: DUF2484 family protein [Rhodobacteraceae bacterium]|nr:DUF2484 family protein [Paracoccaceae bacterium]